MKSISESIHRRTVRLLHAALPGAASMGLAVLLGAAHAQGTSTAAAMGAASVAGSAPTTAALQVKDFDTTTWARLMKTGPRPAAYLFTTSYCSTCPEAFEKIHDYTAAHKKNVPLMAVMMDVSGEQALRHAAHFPGMTQMYVFNGYEAEVRQSVDRSWPNITPYVVLVSKSGRAQRFIGPPTPAALRAWLG